MAFSAAIWASEVHFLPCVKAWVTGKIKWLRFKSLYSAGADAENINQPPDATAAISWGPCLCMRVPTHFWTSRLGRRHTLAGSGLELRGVRAFWE